MELEKNLVNKPNVVVDLDRYEELISIETRLNVLCSLLIEKDLEIKEIFNVVGRTYLVRDYEERLEKERIRREEWLRKEG